MKVFIPIPNVAELLKPTTWANMEIVLLANNYIARHGYKFIIDPFQGSLPCWDHKSATTYAIRSFQERELSEIKSCTGADGKTYLY